MKQPGNHRPFQLGIGLTQVKLPPSQLPPAPVVDGRTLASYEYADDAALDAEKKRLVEEKELLKAHKSDLKTQKKKLKTKINDLEDQNAGAEQIATAEAEKKAVEAELDATKDLLKENRIDKRNTKNFLITPFAAPSYTPEMGFLIAGGGLASFKTNRLDPKIGRSSINMMGGWGTKPAGMLYLKAQTYWLRDILRISNENWFKSMSDNYWGVWATTTRPAGTMPTATPSIIGCGGVKTCRRLRVSASTASTAASIS